MPSRSSTTAPKEPPLSLPHNGDAGVFQKWQSAGLQEPETEHELLFRFGGQPSALRNVFQSSAAFLIGGGPSFRSIDASRLNAPGFITMGMNNTVKTYRPNTWICVDQPSNFLRSIWLDSKILKCVPASHCEQPIFDSDSWQFMDRLVHQCPNVFFFPRTERFETSFFLSEPGVNWGSHRRFGGGRSVFLSALRLLHYFGIRHVFLLGVDFRMFEEHRYHFDQERSRQAIRGNNRTYSILQKRLTELRPILEQEQFYIYNCNPDSALQVFPYLDFEDALAFAGRELPQDPRQERSAGLYDHRKPSPPPSPQNSSQEPQDTPDALARDFQTPSSRTPQLISPKPSRHDNNVKRGVVVGLDSHIEWLLPWWWRNYSSHNQFPVSFLDFGMSDAGRTECSRYGTVIALPPDFPALPQAWFYKPCMFVLPVQPHLLAIDLDCEIRGPLDEIFEFISNDIVLARDQHPCSGYRNRFDAQKYFNTGVIAAQRCHPILMEWGQVTLREYHDFRSDQEILNAVLSRTEARVVVLPQRFNRLRLDGEDPEAVIMHWTGPKGKRIIRQQLRSPGLPGC